MPRICKALEGHEIPEGVEILQVAFTAEQDLLRSLIEGISGVVSPPRPPTPPLPGKAAKIVGAHEISSKFAPKSPEAQAIEADAIELIRRILREPPPES